MPENPISPGNGICRDASYVLTLHTQHVPKPWWLQLLNTSPFRALLPADSKSPPSPWSLGMCSNGSHLPFCKMFTHVLSLLASFQSTVIEKAHIWSCLFFIWNIKMASYCPQDKEKPGAPAWPGPGDASSHLTSTVPSAHLLLSQGPGAHSSHPLSYFLTQRSPSWVTLTGPVSLSHMSNNSNDMRVVCVNACLLCWILKRPGERRCVGPAWVLTGLGTVCVHSKWGPSLLITVFEACVSQDHPHATQVLVFRASGYPWELPVSPNRCPNITSGLKRWGEGGILLMWFFLTIVTAGCIPLHMINGNQSDNQDFNCDSFSLNWEKVQKWRKRECSFPQSLLPGINRKMSVQRQYEIVVICA